MQIHIDRMPNWKNVKVGSQRINSPHDDTFLKIWRISVDSIREPEVLLPVTYLD